MTFVTVHNGLPRSILRHWRRRQTRRQAFSFGVIDFASVCGKEHLTDCGVVVIHVFGEPLLGHGLLIELDVSLCEEAVFRLTTCWGGVLVIRPHLLSESAQGYLLLNLREVEVLENKDEEEEESEVDERSRTSERTLNSCMRHGDDHGMEWDANANILSQCAMCKGWVWKQQKQRLTAKTATLRVCSRVPQVFFSRCTHCWVSCCASCWSCASGRQ